MICENSLANKNCQNSIFQFIGYVANELQSQKREGKERQRERNMEKIISLYQKRPNRHINKL